jgi:4-carboxymuconolactone decarboxylase
MATLEDRRALGAQIQRDLFGEYPPAVRGPAIDIISRDWAEFADETVFGFGWARGVISRRERSMVTCAALAAQGMERQLVQHLKGALNLGITPEELIEVCMQLVFYAGWPKAQNALQMLVEVLAARGELEGVAKRIAEARATLNNGEK